LLGGTGLLDSHLDTFSGAVMFDGLVKSRKSAIFVIAAEAAIQSFQDVMDPGLRRGDGLGTFYEFIMFR